MDRQGIKDLQECLVKMALLVNLVNVVLLEKTVHLDQQANLESLDLLDQLEKLVPQVKVDLLDLKVFLVKLEDLVKQEKRVHQDLKGLKERLEFQEPLAYQ